MSAQAKPCGLRHNVRGDEPTRRAFARCHARTFMRTLA